MDKKKTTTTTTLCLLVEDIINDKTAYLSMLAFGIKYWYWSLEGAIVVSVWFNWKGCMWFHWKGLREENERVKE